MKNNESLQMYIESIYVLERYHGHAHSSEIAKMLHVSRPSVTKAMNKLKESELILKENYGTITLTAYGREVAKSQYEKSGAISKYLMKTLDLSEEEAFCNAGKIKCCISDKMMKAIETYVGDECST